MITLFTFLKIKQTQKPFMYYFLCGHISPKYLFHVGTEVGTEGELGRAVLFSDRAPSE